MRFSLSSSALSSRLNILSKVIIPKNSMQILECIKFQIKGNELILTASDNANVLTSKAELTDASEDFSFCIPSKTILTAVKELAEQPITIEVNPNDYSMEIIYTNGAYKLMAQSADEYPVMQPLSTNYTETTIDSAVLLSNINRSLFATASDELRMVMNGLYFDLREDSLFIVATDGHKLVRNRVFSCKSDMPSSFILPKKPATLLRNMNVGEGEEVSIRFNASNAEICISDFVLSCRLIEGRYPNYASVIPNDNPNQLTVDRKSLISAMRRIMPFASESTQLVKLRISYNELEVNAEDIDFSSSARESLTCEYGGMPMSIGFKGSVLYEICNNLTSDDIIINLSDPSRAGVICPAEQPENEDILMLIMPMLLNE